MTTEFRISMQLRDTRGESAGEVADSLRAVLEVPAFVYCEGPRCQRDARLAAGCLGHTRQRFSIDDLAVIPTDGKRARFVAVRKAVMMGSECVLTARSHTMAKRAANALNNHIPTREGV